MVDIDLTVPNENQNDNQYEDFRVTTHYSVEADVFEATGLTSQFLQTLGGLSSAQVTLLLNGYIAKADERIRRWLGIPITVRKEGHEFFNNPIVELGPDREDPFEMFGSYDPLDKTEEIFAIYYNEYRTKVPYPKNWDQFTEAAYLTKWGIDDGIVGGTTTLVADTSIKKCGGASLKATVARVAGGNIYYPINKNLNRRIYPWFYAGFYLMTDTPSTNFQFRIYRDTGSYYYGNFVVSTAGNNSLSMTWVPIQLSIRRFQFANAGGEGAQPDFNWILTYTQYIKIVADRPCKFWIDNFNFNDGFFATYPEGTISWCMPECYPRGRISVTYSYDPFKNSIPPALLEASSKLAGVLLLDWCIGKRQMVVAFVENADTLAEQPDKVTLESSRRRLETEAYTALETLGYKSYEGIG
jgi:hypothetical protein